MSGDTTTADAVSWYICPCGETTPGLLLAFHRGVCPGCGETAAQRAARAQAAWWAERGDHARAAKVLELAGLS